MPPIRLRMNLDTLEVRDVPAAGLDDVFNAGRYLLQNPDVAAAVQAKIISAEDHFRKFAGNESRSGVTLLDPKYYADNNPDVAAAVAAGTTTAVDHFLGFGQGEGRNPSKNFNTSDYLAANPDVAEAVKARKLNAFEHFAKFGQFEERSPNITYNPRLYLEDNPDVKDAVSQGIFRSGTQHFLNNGQFEVRSKAISFQGLFDTTKSFEGISANSGDKKYFSFTTTTTKNIRFDLTRLSGDFAKLELETYGTDSKLLELEPKNGVTTGTVTLTAGTYIMRVRASGDAAAQFRVTLTSV